MQETTRQYLDRSYKLHCVDWRDSIPARDMVQCLERKDCSAIWESLYDDDYILREIMEQIEQRMTSEGHGELFDQDREEIREWVEEHDTSSPVKELCRNSEYRARVLQHSNYECWIPPYEGGTITYDKAFKETVDLLALNPKEVKKELSKWAVCEGRWPDRPDRRPIVKTEDFSNCCRNTFCYGMWGFFGSIKGRFLYNSDFEIDGTCIIPKGTTCGWANWWNGGGTLELIETIRDVSMKELKRNLRSKNEYTSIDFELDEKDACRGYPIMPEVYGTTIEEQIFKN